MCQAHLIYGPGDEEFKNGVISNVSNGDKLLCAVPGTYFKY